MACDDLSIPCPLAHNPAMTGISDKTGCYSNILVRKVSDIFTEPDKIIMIIKLLSGFVWSL
ncbi:MAG: hypothetical protein ACI4LK_03435 [Lentihominibacter sp.]